VESSRLGAKPADALARAKARIAELERLVGRQQADLHFFREALRLWDAASQESGAPASMRSSKKRPPGRKASARTTPTSNGCAR
jgi:hypothetical protein